MTGQATKRFPKRFWTSATLVESNGRWGISLDGRALTTPARATLSLPNRALGEEIAAEWNQCGDELDPSAMPLTGLANAAVDHVTPDPDRFAADIARYAEGDLLCYRADVPPSLLAAQSASWNPLLEWARQRFKIDFALASGIIHIPQPATTVTKLRETVSILDPFHLTALAPIVTISGSLVAALALNERAFPVETLWNAVSLDDRWQLEKWGADAEAVAALDARRRDFLAAAHFLDLLD